MTQSSSAPFAIAPPLPDIISTRPYRGGLRGIVNRHFAASLGAAVLIVLIIVAIFAPYLGTIDPIAINPGLRARAPSAAAWFGTDVLGRDIYSRVVFGTRVSLTVGFAVAILATGIGTLIGLICGYVRSIDSIVMRLMDAVMSIPSILLAIALVALTRASVGNVIAAIVVAEIPRVARLVRGVVFSLRELAYVEAAVSSGSSGSFILLRHILPNAIAPIIVQATYICASAMIVEATLSFIGAGTPPTTPSWGNIMADGRALWQVKPYIVLFPAAFLSLTVLSVNMVGDGLRDALDPRMAKVS
ncbi:ABC transporter permease [Agrobacterium larrymoorei]|uniref:ABC transporter permease n=1 Tax=Agrobacterium larrymoorei TaxID=160699 RepID=A0AAF0HDG0_9HYPH|nr:ABC transporter permease [Agrobacterium larrymoorei]WHA43892.1 ABC transporter permease [Agrobacterium larrymoorei]